MFFDQDPRINISFLESLPNVTFVDHDIIKKKQDFIDFLQYYLENQKKIGFF